jgi:hypothetical protein
MERVWSWLREQVDEEERRLLIQACVVGVVVWVFVIVLKLAVHTGFELLANALAQTHSVAFVWIPLVLGAIGVSWRETADGNVDERVVLNPRPDQVLTRGDLLIVLGEDERIAAFAMASRDSLQPKASAAAAEGRRRGV